MWLCSISCHVGVRFCARLVVHILLLATAGNLCCHPVNHCSNHMRFAAAGLLRMELPHSRRLSGGGFADCGAAAAHTAGGWQCLVQSGVPGTQQHRTSSQKRSSTAQLPPNDVASCDVEIPAALECPQQDITPPLRHLTSAAAGQRSGACCLVPPCVGGLHGIGCNEIRAAPDQGASCTQLHAPAAASHVEQSSHLIHCCFRNRKEILPVIHISRCTLQVLRVAFTIVAECLSLQLRALLPAAKPCAHPPLSAALNT